MASNPTLNRLLAKMLAEAKTLAGSARRRVRSRKCEGADWPELLRMLWDAADDEGKAVLDEIAAQVEEYVRQAPPSKPDWQSDEDFAADPDAQFWPHGFTCWLGMLRGGHASLPESLPTPALAAWRDAYRDRNAWRWDSDSPKVSPIVTRRCAACHMAVCDRAFEACPVCGGAEWQHVNLGWGEDGDPVFHPVRKGRKAK